MKQMIRGFMMLSLVSLAMPAIAQPTSSQEISPAKLQSSQTQPTQPVTAPQAELQQILDALFRPKAVTISFSSFLEKGSAKQVTSSGNMYYSNGKLFVLYDKGSKGFSKTNFATINGKLYAWDVGEKQGKILKRRDEDTAALLLYLIDVPGFKRATYFQEYQWKRNNFDLKQESYTKTLTFKKVDFIAGIRFEENPLWLRSLLICQCQFVTPTTELWVSEVNRPIPLEKIPDSVKVLPTGIKFKTTSETVQSYMGYP